MKKTLFSLSLSLICTWASADINPNSQPRKDISNLSKKTITTFNPTDGNGKDVAEYEPLNNFDGDCENILPFAAKANGELSLSTQHFKGGKRSLRWNYTKNDVMTFTFDKHKSLLSPEYITRGKDGTAFLYMWIYNTKSI